MSTLHAKIDLITELWPADYLFMNNKRLPFIFTHDELI